MKREVLAVNRNPVHLVPGFVPEAVGSLKVTAIGTSSESFENLMDAVKLEISKRGWSSADFEYILTQTEE